jgi:hypothetical protein
MHPKQILVPSYSQESIRTDSTRRRETAFTSA